MKVRRRTFFVWGSTAKGLEKKVQGKEGCRVRNKTPTVMHGADQPESRLGGGGRSRADVSGFSELNDLPA